jgi:hypothetical protein
VTLRWFSHRHLQIKISVIKGSKDCFNPVSGYKQKRIFHYRYAEGQLTVTENILCPLFNFISSRPYLASKALLVWKLLFKHREEYFTCCWLKRSPMLWNEQRRGEPYNSPTLFSLPLIYLISYILLNLSCFVLTYRILVSSFISSVLLHVLFFYSVSFYLTFPNLCATAVIFSFPLSIYGNRVFFLKGYSRFYISHVFITLICNRHDLAAVQLYLLHFHLTCINTCSWVQDILWSLNAWLHVEMQFGAPNMNTMCEWTRILNS